MWGQPHESLPFYLFEAFLAHLLNEYESHTQLSSNFLLRTVSFGLIVHQAKKVPLSPDFYFRGCDPPSPHGSCLYGLVVRSLFSEPMSLIKYVTLDWLLELSVSRFPSINGRVIVTM